MNNNTMSQLFEQWRMHANRQPMAVEMQKADDNDETTIGYNSTAMADELDLQYFFA